MNKRAIPVGGAPKFDNQSTWHPDPQKPSGPCVPLTVDQNLSCIVGTEPGCIEDRSSPCGPLLGFSYRATSAPAELRRVKEFRAGFNIIRGKTRQIEGWLVNHSHCHCSFFGAQLRVAVRGQRAFGQRLGSYVDHESFLAARVSWQPPRH